MDEFDLRVSLLTCDALLEESDPDSDKVDIWKDDLKRIMEYAWQYLDLCK